jgi:hypothetical protein
LVMKPSYSWFSMLVTLFDPYFHFIMHESEVEDPVGRFVLFCHVELVVWSNSE